MSAIRQLAVFAENRPGQLARLTRTLAEAEVNLRWLTIGTTGGFGVMCLVVDRCDAALLRLKESGFTVSVREVLAVEVDDKPGSLAEVVGVLSRHDINVQNASGWLRGGRAVLLLDCDQLSRAAETLRASGVRLLTEDQIVTYG